MHAALCLSTGPPFTHPRLPYASHFVGSTSPRNNPSHYLASIQALIHTYRLDIQHPVPEDDFFSPDDLKIHDVVPLVVNTMGWTKGLGMNLACQIEDLIDPTHVLSVQDEDGKTSSGNRQLYKLEPVSSLARYSAADWRSVSLMSYFYSVFSQADHALEHSWDCRLPLVAQAPFAVDLSSAFNNVVLTGTGYEDVCPFEIGRVLNGALVALVSDQHPFDGNQLIPYTQGAEVPDPSSSNCIGLAFIRSVSPSLISVSDNGGSDHILHLLTPLPPRLLTNSSARCLVKGEIELPVWGFLDHHDPDTGKVTPYLQWSRRDMAGAHPWRVRRNLMRKGQMWG